MILTESDLHAYNRGELPEDAVRQLEDDPLAMQDAARLRAIAEAVRDERPITVYGRAETLERLRAKSRPRVGVSGWVWATGAASVLALVFVSIPQETRSSIRYETVAYKGAESAASAAAPAIEAAESEAAETLRSPSRSRSRSGSTATAGAESQKRAIERDEGRVQTDFASPRGTGAAPGEASGSTSSLLVRVTDVDVAKTVIEETTRTAGGKVIDRSVSPSGQPPSVTLTLRFPPAARDQVIRKIRSVGQVGAQSQALSNRSSADPSVLRVTLTKSPRR